MSLSGKVALITGSSQGIGKATALRLASEGAGLVINYRSDSAAANSVVEQIGADRAIAVQADASKLPDLDWLVEATVARFGKIDILIPNAGILVMKDLENTTEEDFDNSHNLMVKGPYFLAQVRCSLFSLLSSIFIFYLYLYMLFLLFQEQSLTDSIESCKIHATWRTYHLRFYQYQCCI